jgi:hypothetical protein
MARAESAGVVRRGIDQLGEEIGTHPMGRPTNPGRLAIATLMRKSYSGAQLL